MTESVSPEQTDWQRWVARFDKMQERYLVRRDERFETIACVLQQTQPLDCRIVELGCGTGSLTEAILDARPGSRVVGVDLDASLLLLAEKRLQRFGDRARLVRGDLRQEDWMSAVDGSCDAAVSSTALHWLSPDNLAVLYSRMAKLLKSGGVFLNADHVGSSEPAIQKQWEHLRQADLLRSCPDGAESWNEFFTAYSKFLGADPNAMGDRAVGPWEGVEEGMPLVWHFDHLRESGFVSCDCFWRCGCDAIYGAFRGR